MEVETKLISSLDEIMEEVETSTPNHESRHQDRQTAGGPRVLSVAGSSEVRKLAGSISHISRAGEPPILQAVGSSSLNQAVKAVAVAR